MSMAQEARFSRNRRCLAAEDLPGFCRACWPHHGHLQPRLCGAHTQLTTMCLGHQAAQVQTQAHTTAGAGAGAFPPVEGLTQVRQLILYGHSSRTQRLLFTSLKIGALRLHCLRRWLAFNVRRCNVRWRRTRILQRIA